MLHPPSFTPPPPPPPSSASTFRDDREHQNLPGLIVEKVLDAQPKLPVHTAYFLLHYCASASGTTASSSATVSRSQSPHPVAGVSQEWPVLASLRNLFVPEDSVLVCFLMEKPAVDAVDSAASKDPVHAHLASVLSSLRSLQQKQQQPSSNQDSVGAGLPAGLCQTLREAHDLEFGQGLGQRLFFVPSSTQETVLETIRKLHELLPLSVHFVLIPEQDAMVTPKRFRNTMETISSSPRPFQPLLPAFSPSAAVDLQQLFLARLQQTPHRSLFEKTVRQVIKVLSKVPDQTVFLPSRFRTEMCLDYLPFSALLLFNLFVREGILKRADPEFSAKHRKGKTNALYLLNRSLVDTLFAAMQNADHGMPVMSPQGQPAGLFAGVSPVPNAAPVIMNSYQPPATMPVRSLQPSPVSVFIPPTPSASLIPTPPPSAASLKDFQVIHKRAEFLRKLIQYALKTRESAILESGLASSGTAEAADFGDWPRMENSLSSYQDKLQSFLERFYPQTPTVEYTSSEEVPLLAGHQVEDAPLFRARVSILNGEQDLESAQGFATEEEAREDVSRLALDFLKLYWKAGKAGVVREEADASRTKSTAAQDHEQSESTRHDEEDLGSEEGEVSDGDEEADEAGRQRSETLGKTSLPQKEPAAPPSTATLAIGLLNEYLQKAKEAPPVLNYTSTNEMHSATMVLGNNHVEFKGKRTWPLRTMARDECAGYAMDRLVETVCANFQGWPLQELEKLEDGTLATALRFQVKADFAQPPSRQ